VNKKKLVTLSLTLFTTSLLLVSSLINVAVAGDTSLPANRYDLPRNYESEISAAAAYSNAIADRERWGERHGHGRWDEGKRPVIVDVRSIPEYVAGHPRGAYNIPYPFIVQDCSTLTPDGACTGHGPRTPQHDDDFVAAVELAVPDKDRPIYTLCRTGHRSVLAANLLTAHGYTHVRNIWQGFVGQTKVDFFLNGPLDLNHDGQITDEDRDGWRYYQHLPYSKKLLPQLLYQPYLYLYYTY
jgi:rhodanese-related sulfurtransferase